MATFKVRRNLHALQSASIYETADIDYGVNTSSGSVSTFSGGLTAASTFTATGCAIIGSASIALAEILCGSFNITTPDCNASATNTATACISDMGTEGSAYKIFLLPQTIGTSQFISKVTASADSPSGVITVTFGNMLSNAAASSLVDAVFNYLAILDK